MAKAPTTVKQAKPRAAKKKPDATPAAEAKETLAHAPENTFEVDSDEAALFAYFARKINEAQAAANVIKAQYDEAKDAVTAEFTKAKGELRIPRKRMEELLAAMKLTDEEFLEDERKRAKEYALAGLPQLDLFAKRDTADDVQMAYNSGHRAGKAGLDPSPPKTIFPALIPDWQRGWADGQSETQKAFLRGQELIAAKERKGKLTEAEEEPDDELAGQIDVEDVTGGPTDEEDWAAAAPRDLPPGENPAIMPDEPDQNARAPGEPIPVG